MTPLRGKVIGYQIFWKGNNSKKFEFYQHARKHYEELEAEGMQPCMYELFQD